MLQRAASNAYSWWWASHVRTKQSKWLEQSLIDMEEKVQHVLKLIEEDGDSFAKRAEMYYKKRPELLFFVEDSYRAYRALAERYDHISTELQNANNTIASVFPERVQFEMDEEDDLAFPKGAKNFQRSPLRNASPKIPEAPPPTRPIKGVLASASENLKPNKAEGRNNGRKGATVNSVEKSGLVKEQALEEIDGLQKEVLALQTVKEFVKRSYENGLAKFWEIEKQIETKQDRVFTLQEEFSIGKVIEDEDARTLMAEAALTSCKETLTHLEKEQEKSAQEAINENKRVEDASKKIESLKEELLPKEEEEINVEEKHNNEKINLPEPLKEHLEAPAASSGNNIPFTISYLAERIDELVTKVISLETAVSSQTGLIDRFKTETEELHAQIRSLENDKANLTNDVNTLKEMLREMEEKLRNLQDMNKDFESQNNNLKTHFTQARHSLDNLSDKLQTMKPDEDPEEVESSHSDSPFSVNFVTIPEDKQVVLGQEEVKQEEEDMAKTIQNEPNDPLVKGNPKTENIKEDDEPNWHEMLLSGVEDREKIILKEYTLVLRNYKDVKRQLGNVEDRSVIHIKELRGVVADRDEEIRNLNQKMNHMRENGIEDNNDNQTDKPQIRPANPFLMKEEDLIKWVLTDRCPSVSILEKKLRLKIDRLLDENLDFWLRFSSQYQQIEKFRTGFHDLQAEVSKLKEKQTQNQEKGWEIKSDIRPIYKHMREIQSELIVWLEQSTLLKDELRRRFSSLCDIEEEISTTFKVDVQEGMRLTSHQAVKLQGEVLTMKQENHKIKDELISGLDHITELQIEIEKTLAELDDDYELSGTKKDVESALKSLPSRTRIPLRAFIFGSKPKKKNSLFSFVSHKQFNELKKAGKL
ncbi:protein NETWORKED 2A-like [Impatiens glandulifera]|uniref:protein NETWORKED 2A-like n=1 Tax=Impatiens glandulifera TaxID=253017 RepID=UPI001FB114FA|nr:protein NETWORKED 2A-like [Impatiens glandulifera]